MKRSLVAKRYARAFFDIARDAGKLDTVEKDLQTIARDYRASADLSSLIESPVVEAQVKRNTLNALFNKKVDAQTARFLDLLVEKGRENVLMDVIADFNDMLDDYRGILRGAVYSVVPLSADQKKELTGNLDKITGKKVVVKEHLDKNLLGGFVVRIEDMVYDSSLRHQLDKLRQNLIES